MRQVVLGRDRLETRALAEKACLTATGMPQHDASSSSTFFLVLAAQPGQLVFKDKMLMILHIHLNLCMLPTLCL